MNQGQLGPAPTRKNSAATPAAASSIGPTTTVEAVTLLTSAAMIRPFKNLLDIGKPPYVMAQSPTRRAVRAIDQKNQHRGGDAHPVRCRINTRPDGAPNSGTTRLVLVRAGSAASSGDSI